MENRTKTRHRIREIKKWSKFEVVKVLNYILQSGRLEKPTAQIYYNKLIAETKIVATWDMLRWKMRNLRVSFQKCNDWLTSTEAKMLEAEQGYNGINSKIQKMCPHYQNLREIYADKNERAAVEEVAYESKTFMIDELVCIKSEVDEEAPAPAPAPPITSSTYFVYDSAAAPSPTISTCAMDDDSGVTILPPTTTATNMGAAAATKTTTAPAVTADTCTDHQESSSSCALKELSKLQSERNRYYDKKIQIQQNKIDKDFLIEERKMKLEEAKFKLEEEKFRANLELRKAELAKDERIAKYEIEIKYKHKN